LEFPTYAGVKNSSTLTCLTVTETLFSQSVQTCERFSIASCCSRFAPPFLFFLYGPAI